MGHHDSRDIHAEQVVVRCQLGDRAAMEELVQAWEARLLYYVRRLVPAEQEPLQVMQNVWVRVFSGLGALRDPRRLAPWLYSLTRNALMDHLRDGYARRALLASTETAAVEPSQEDDAMSEFIAAEEVHVGLSRVSVVDREVLTLFFLNDLSIDQIAAVLGVPPGTVKSRLFHARAAMREALREPESSRAASRTPATDQPHPSFRRER